MATSSSPPSPEPEAEEEEDYNDEDLHCDFIEDSVLRMLNFKVVPKEPNDPGYRPNSYIPPEAQIYAKDFCRMQNIIDQLTADKTRLEGLILEPSEELEQEKNKVAEKDKQLEEKDQKLQEKEEELEEKEKCIEELRAEIENLSGSNSEEARNVAKENEKLKKELETLKNALSEKDNAVETIKLQLQTSEDQLSKQKDLSENQAKEIAASKKEKEDLGGVLLERKKEIDEQCKVASDLRKDVENYKAANSQLSAEKEEMQKQIADLESQMNQLQTEKDQLGQEVAISKESLSDLEKVVKSEQDRNSQLCGENETLKKDIKEILLKSEETNKELSQVSVLLAESKKAVAGVQQELNRTIEERSQYKSELDTSQLTIDDLEGQVIKTEQKANEQVQKLHKQIETLKEAVDNERQAKEASVEKCKKLQTSLVEFSETANEMKTMIDTVTSADSSNCPSESDVNSLLDRMSAFLDNRFNSYLKTQESFQETVANTRKLALAMYQMAGHFNRAPALAPARSPTTPTSSPVVSAANPRIATSTLADFPPIMATCSREAATTPVRPAPRPSLSLAQSPAFSPVVKISYRDIVKSTEKGPIQSPANTPLSSSAFPVPSPFLTPRAPVSNPQPTTSFSGPSTSTAGPVPSGSRNTVTNPEVRQLFVDPNPSPSKRISNSSEVLHEVDTTKAGHFCRCGRDCSSAERLKKHVNYYTQDWNLECHICQQRFCIQGNLNQHLASKHKIKVPERRGLIGCRECGKQFSTRMKFTQHRRTVHTIQMSKKIIQGRTNSQPSSQPPSATASEIKSKLLLSLKNTKTRQNSHWTIVSNNSGGENSIWESFEEVEAEDNDPEDNTTHRRGEQGVPKITGVRGYNSKRASMKHGVDPKKENTCLCKLKCKSKHILHSHIQYHTAERKFSCDLCPRKFVGGNNLRCHYRRAHNILKPAGSYGCRKCGKNFDSFKTLWRHQKAYGHNHNKNSTVDGGGESLESAPNSVINENEMDMETSSVNGTTTADSNPTNGDEASRTEGNNDHLFSEIITTLKATIPKPKEINPEQPGCSRDVGTSSPVKNSQLQKQHGVDLSRKGFYCLCGKKSPHKEALQKHVNYHNPMCHFQCSHCEVKYVSTALLRKHMRVKHGKVYSLKGCRFCGQTFSEINDLLAHQRTDSCSKNEGAKLLPEENPTEESSADLYTFNDTENENTENSPPIRANINNSKLRHGEDLSKVQPGMFCLCGVKCRTRAVLVAHIVRSEKLCSSQRKFPCNICHKRFGVHAELRKHLRRVHKVLNLPSEGLKGCRVCGRLFQTLKELRQHRDLAHARKIIHKKNPVIKIVKQIMSKSVKHLISLGHVKSEQQSQDPTSSQQGNNIKHAMDWSKARKKGIFCKCGLKFKTKAYLVKHINYYRTQNHFQCPLCHLRFKATGYVKQHMKVVHNDSSYNLKGCSLCGAIFNTLEEMRQHQKDHHHRKRVKVPVLDLTVASTPARNPQDDQEFQLPEPIQPEISLDTPQPIPIELPEIPRGPSIRIPVTQRPVLSVTKKKHGIDMSKRHLGYYCICKTRSTSEKGLKYHVMYFSSERNFNCELCTSRFVFLSQLKSHMARSHKKYNVNQHGSKGCKTCGEAFPTFYDLAQHRKSAHSMQETASDVPTPSTSAQAAYSMLPVPSTSRAGAPQSTNTSTGVNFGGQHAIDLSKIPYHVCKCGSPFGDVNALRDHILVMRGHESLAPKNPVIPSPQKSPLNLHKPVKIVNRPDLFVCLCGKQYGSEGLLLEHTKNPQDGSPNITGNQESPQNHQKLKIKPIFSSAVTATENLKTSDHALDISKKARNSVFCICGTEFASKHNLAAHTQFFALGKKFPCQLCPKKFAGIGDMNKHKKTFHSAVDVTGNIGCNSCGVIFSSKKEYQRHRVRTFANGKWAKVFCPSRIAADPSLLENTEPSPNTISGNETTLEEIHPTASLIQEAASSNQRNAWIPVNPNISVRIAAPRNESNSDVEPVPAQLLTTMEPVLSPVNPVHGIDASQSALGFFCYCGQQCSNKHTLNRHIKRFTAEKKFVCNNCGKAFLVASQLRYHKLRVHKIAENISNGCKQCGETFPTNMELYHHFKIVHNQGSQWEPWETKYTPPTQATSSSQQEMSQELPIEIQNTDSNALAPQQPEGAEIHQPIPIDPLADDLVNRHQCTCGRVFQSLNSLRVHIRSKTVGKIFKCSWCPITFDLHGNLKKHVRGVHKRDYQNGKFACGVCAETFPTYDAVKSHRIAVHVRNETVTVPVSNNISDSEEIMEVLYET